MEWADEQHGRGRCGGGPLSVHRDHPACTASAVVLSTVPGTPNTQVIGIVYLSGALFLCRTYHHLNSFVFLFVFVPLQNASARRAGTLSFLLTAVTGL